jgi:hypothetical protein
MNNKEYLKSATTSCKNRMEFDWNLDDSAVRVIKFGNDDYLVVEYGPSEDGLVIEEYSLMNTKQCYYYLTDVLLIDMLNSDLRLFFEGRL